MGEDYESFYTIYSGGDILDQGRHSDYYNPKRVRRQEKMKRNVFEFTCDACPTKCITRFINDTHTLPDGWGEFNYTTVQYLCPECATIVADLLQKRRNDTSVEI